MSQKPKWWMHFWSSQEKAHLAITAFINKKNRVRRNHTKDTKHDLDCLIWMITKYYTYLIHYSLSLTNRPPHSSFCLYWDSGIDILSSLLGLLIVYHWIRFHRIVKIKRFWLSMSDAGYRMLGAGARGWPREMLWGRRWEGGSCSGTHVHPWWIHVNVWQNQYSIVK